MKDDSMPALEIRVEDLHKSLGGNSVLKGVSFEVRRGEMVAILGSSGSGKTTLLRHLTGHYLPDSGKVLLADHESDGSPLVDLSTLNVAGMERLERHWAVVFQKNGLLSGTVYDGIALPLRLVLGLDERAVRTRVTEVLGAVGLEMGKDADLNVEQLSGGMAKRVAIAGALAVDPILILYDEPTTGLDPSRDYQIQDLIRDVHVRRTASGFARTSVMITHDKDLLLRLRPRVLMLDEGRIVFDGSHDEFQHSDLPAIRPYLEAMSAFQQPFPPTAVHSAVTR